MIESVEKIKVNFEQDIKKLKSVDELEALRVSYLGRKGQIATAFSTMSDLPPQDRPKLGQQLNQLKQRIEADYTQLLERLQGSGPTSSIDLTLPGRKPFTGNKHPIVQVAEKIKKIFRHLGFVVEDGPEIETDYYNFEALNFPDNHPSRDMQDTLFIEDEIVLRTHTSPVQIRVMEKRQPPIRMIAPGRVHRRDTPDASHSPFFHQVEGLSVGENVSFADLKGVIESFAHIMFGKDIKVRFRPSFFPFTEPSVEYDFSCVFCRGKGCRVCKGTGWMEISGAGMVHPNVFKFVDYDPDKISGYAFGMGVDRIAMLLFNINDIRMLFENDLRLLNQF